jgi:hypothetical protein
MTESKIVHLIRTSSGEVLATARGISPEAGKAYRDSGCEIFAFNVELPVQVAVDVAGTAKRIDG